MRPLQEPSRRPPRRPPRSAALFLASLSLAACAPSRFVEPVPLHSRALTFTLGGPISGKEPLPFTSIAGAYGVRERLTAFGAVHTTAALFGVAQAELGLVQGVARPAGRRPGVSVAPVANLALGHGATKAWPQLDANAYWKPGGRLAYVGVSNEFDLGAQRVDGQGQSHWVPGMQAGYVFGTGRWSWGAEVKWLALRSTGHAVPEYVSPGGRGALGIYFSVTRRSHERAHS